MGTSRSNVARLLGGVRHQASTTFASLSRALGFERQGQLSVEILIILALCAVAGAWAVFQFLQFDFLRLCRGFDFWFDSDPARTIANITSRWVMFHERSTLHPLYSLFIAAPFGFVGEAFGLRTSTVTLLYVGAQSGLYAGTAYVTMRAFTLGRFDSLLGVLLIYSTAASIYWIGLPEWIAFGAAAVLISIIWAIGPIRSHVTGVAQSLISGSIVVTSWAIGFAASLLADWPKIDWRRAYTHTRDALALMAALSVLQYSLFPSAGGFLNIWYQFRLSFLRDIPEHVSRPLLSLTLEFFGQTLLAPQAAVLAGPKVGGGWGTLLMTGQRQALPITSLSVVVIGLWIVLWSLGVLAAIQGRVGRIACLFVVGALAYLFALHITFGGELFLFSLQFAPLIAFIAMWSVRSGYQMIARGLCIALIVASFSYNYPAFRSSIAAHNSLDVSWFDRDHAAAVEAAKTDCG